MMEYSMQSFGEEEQKINDDFQFDNQQ